MKYIIACLLIGLALPLNAQQTRKIKDSNIVADTSVTKKVEELPQVKEGEKLNVINRMKEYKEVQEALVVQQDEIRKVSLALIVKQGTSKKRARELGNHFLEKAISHFGAEKENGGKTGKTLYNYMISVCTDRDVIIMGTKTPSEKIITW